MNLVEFSLAVSRMLGRCEAEGLDPRDVNVALANGNPVMGLRIWNDKLSDQSIVHNIVIEG